LAECLDTIRWSAESVNRECLEELKNKKQPERVVKDVLEAVGLLLGQKDVKWDALKKMIASPTFVDKVQKFNFKQQVDLPKFKKLREQLQSPDFDEEIVKSICVPVVPLAMWCRSIGFYLSRTKFTRGPEIRPVAACGAPPEPPPESRERAQPVDRRPTSTAHMIFTPDLDLLSPEELACVEELAIERPDVGRIQFHGITDCSGLDFDTLVRLEIGEVLVYPDSLSKPPVGEGLNKPAAVELYQCWPPSGSMLGKDGKSQDKYKNKIKKMTEDKGAEFVGYDCNTGIWKFCVKHF